MANDWLRWWISMSPISLMLQKTCFIFQNAIIIRERIFEILPLTKRNRALCRKRSKLHFPSHEKSCNGQSGYLGCCLLDKEHYHSLTTINSLKANKRTWNSAVAKLWKCCNFHLWITNVLYNSSIILLPEKNSPLKTNWHNTSRTY